MKNFLRGLGPLLPAFEACLHDAARALRDRLATLRGNPQVHRAAQTRMAFVDAGPPSIQGTKVG